MPPCRHSVFLSRLYPSSISTTSLSSNTLNKWPYSNLPVKQTFVSFRMKPRSCNSTKKHNLCNETFGFASSTRGLFTWNQNHSLVYFTYVEPLFIDMDYIVVSLEQRICFYCFRFNVCQAVLQSSKFVVFCQSWFYAIGMPFQISTFDVIL